MRKIAVSILFCMLSIPFFADKPAPPPQTYKEYSPNKKYHVIADYENNTTVCYEAAVDNPVKRWTIAGWHRYCRITDDGQFCIIFHDSMNLLPLNYAKKDILFTVYKNGEKYDRKTVGEVIQSGKKLQKTSSHYYWGDVAGIYNQGIILNTVEGIKLYDFNSKSFLYKNKERCVSAWQEDEIVGYRFELISDTQVESFSFEKEDTGERSVRCVYGKHGGAVTGPVEYWHIDTDGYLYIHTEFDNSKNAKKIGKIYVNREKKLLYALKGNKIVRYAIIRLTCICDSSAMSG